MKLSTAFKTQLGLYVPLLSLYVATFTTGDKGWLNMWGYLKPDMSAAVYPDLNPASDTQSTASRFSTFKLTWLGSSFHSWLGI